MTVAADGRGDVTGVQEAVDVVPSGTSAPYTIRIRPGTYRGAVTVPEGKPPITFVGLGRDPSRVVVVDDRANGTLRQDGTPYGTSGSATMTISANDVTVRNLTVANDFDEAAHPEITNRQAVAVLTKGDRIVFDRVRFLGNQDTLYLNSPAVTTVSRVYLHRCYVEGDVDVIFGRATAVLDRCELHSLDRGSTTNNGYLTAPSTAGDNPHGFLIVHSVLTGSAPPGTVHLGRPWHPGGDVTASPQVLVRESRIDGHVRPDAWTDMSGFSWRDARFAEYRNVGAGAVVTPDRPQLGVEEAASATPRAYLAGVDGWDPMR
ncbi:MAG: pectin esterase [Actinomycetales bacterium]|nr:pectin esterase [Actinomycetales bacterium]